MRTKGKFFVAVIIMCFAYTPTVNAQNWYKGNLHTHSLWSDGDDYPEMVTEWYKTHGYNFIGLSEHNKIQEGSNWILVNSDVGKKAYNKYLNRFGSLVDYVHWSNDLRVRLKTLEEYRGLFEEKGKFMIFQNEEITSNLNSHPLHMVATNIKYVIEGQYGKSNTEIIQKTVNQANEQRKETGWKTIVQLNHPNFGYAVTAADIMPVKNLRFFEVHNGAPATHNYGNAVNDSTEVIWDKVNLHFYKEGRPLLYGNGVDDTHNYHEMNPGLNNPGRAWIMVYAAELTPSAIIDAMESGRYYASTGVVLEGLSFSNKKISLRVKQEDGVTYKIQFIGVRKGKERSEILKEVAGAEAEYVLGSDDLFVRAKIISSKLKENVSAVGDVETAWTQPVARR